MYPEVSTMESGELLRSECSDNGERGVKCKDAVDEGESGRGGNGVRSKDPGNEGDNGDSGKGGRTRAWSSGDEWKKSS